MIGIDDQTVIVRIPVQRVKIRFGGNEREVLQLAPGFSWAEYGDGNAFPISCPLEEYIMSALTNTGNIGQNIYFQFEAAGERSNDGQDEKQTSVTNYQTGL